MDRNEEIKKRVLLRVETIKKNKTLSKLIRKHGNDYHDVFSNVNNSIFGEYFMNEFNKRFNPAPESNRATSKTKKVILDYLDCDCLQFYIDCVEEIMNDIIVTGCTFNQALKAITPKAKVTLELIHPEKVILQKSINYETKKYQQNLKKGLVKNNQNKIAMDPNKSPTLFTVFTEEAITDPVIYTVSPAKDYNDWINSKEYKDYMIEDEYEND